MTKKKKDDFISAPGNSKDQKQTADTLFNLFSTSKARKEKTLFADAWLKKKALKV
jgi:hypothetical protein